MLRQQEIILYELKGMSADRYTEWKSNIEHEIVSQRREER